MTLSAQRCVFSGILTIWGILMLYFYTSGRITSYLHPSFQIWTAIAGGVMVALSIGVFFLPSVDHSCDDDGCITPHAKGGNLRLLVLGLVLVVPILVAAVVSPDQFGPNTILNRGYAQNARDLPAYKGPAGSTSDDGTAEDFIPKNAAGQIKTEPDDLVYGAQDPAIRADFENKEVVMVGQYMPAQGNNAAGNRFSLVKMVITCCAADARPVATMVQSVGQPKISEMSWVKITGKATFPVEGGRMIPVVVADTVTPCDPPEDAFIYN